MATEKLRFTSCMKNPAEIKASISSKMYMIKSSGVMFPPPSCRCTSDGGPPALLRTGPLALRWPLTWRSLRQSGETVVRSRGCFRTAPVDRSSDIIRTTGLVTGLTSCLLSVSQSVRTLLRFWNPADQTVRVEPRSVGR